MYIDIDKIITKKRKTNMGFKMKLTINRQKKIK